MDVLADAELIAFVPTVDLEAALAFYQGVLGLRLLEETPQALVFQANGTMLRVSAVQRLVPAPYTVIGWRVDDIAATVRALAARGVTVHRYDGLDQDEAGVWTAPTGDRVTWFSDPDGNVLSLTEFH